MLSTAFTQVNLGRRRILGALSALGIAALAGCAPTQPSDVAAPSEAIDLSQPVRVALLVPLGTGDPGREEIGQSLVNAARLAETDLAGLPLDLQIYETGGSAAGGASAARRAVEDGARIIVGPLFSTETAGAGPVAASAGVPVLSFSNNPDVAGGSVYLLGLTFDNSAARVVSHARSQGLDRFGIVYPNGIEGETARRAVAAAVSRQGGSIVAERGYNLSVADIERASRPIADTLRSSGANAVVLADVPTGGLGYVADGLRKAGLDSGAVQFLGIHRWDVSAEVLNQPSLQGAWFAAPDPAFLNRFESRYRAAYGMRPHELAGLAYDGVAAVGALVREAIGGSNPAPFSAASLTDPSGFAGVYGPFRLLPGGLNQRNLAIREVRSGSAPVIAPATRTFDPLVN